MKGLVYQDCNTEGISRKKNKNSFSYWYKGKQVSDLETLQRIKGLVIPPAWQDVWISPVPTGHIQATGLDSKNRKQYRYHARWSTLRNKQKFGSLLYLGENLPIMRKRISKILRKPGVSQEKILALVLRIMERTHIRIGNEVYEKLYGSFGVTTLRNRHVFIDGDDIRFIFKGKKGVMHHICLNDKKLAGMLQKCKEIPGKELFQYEDENGQICPVDSGMVNGYIQQYLCDDCTAKDFRTWSASVLMLEALAPAMQNAKKDIPAKKILHEAIKKVALDLGNTTTVCRKYYIHPLIIEWFESGKLASIYGRTHPRTHSFYTFYEQLFLIILKKEKRSVESSSKTFPC